MFLGVVGVWVWKCRDFGYGGFRIECGKFLGIFYVFWVLDVEKGVVIE